ncbi:MAG: hypothetical protein ACXADY_06755 [Candidatus Hodarchaeales archaeon]
MKQMKLSSTWYSYLRQRIWPRNQNIYHINWKQHLISLYIIRHSDGICLFSHHFQLGRISQIENQLVGMGFTAISQMMQEIVDSSSSLVLMDLGFKKVLIEEKDNILGILVTTVNSSFFREKLEELTNHFEKMFELQQQIDLETCVCLDNYALTTELVSLVFKDQPTRVLEVIPIIFKSIRKNKSIATKQERTFENLITTKRFQSK